MNTKKSATIQEIEILYNDAEIRDTTETMMARTAFINAVKQSGADIDDEDELLRELEDADEKQGFVAGFRCAARMFGLLMEARG